MRFSVRRKPTLRFELLRTRETTITFASSPWKLSTVARRGVWSKGFLLDCLVTI
jgi:hypothetical protein